MHTSKRHLGLGPVGWPLLALALALAWVYATGHDLRYDLQRLICAVSGPGGLIWFTVYIIHAHAYILYEPAFGPIALTYMLLAPRLARHHPTRLAYAALALWAVIGPAVWMWG